MTDTPDRVVVEDVFGEFGFRVRWTLYPSHIEGVFCIATAEVWEILTYRNFHGPNQSPCFHKDGADDCSEHVDTVDESDKYLRARIKWDGCSNVDFQEETETHLCGTVEWKKHIALLCYLYNRAFQLMNRDMEDPWDSTPMPEMTISPVETDERNAP